MTTNRRGVRGRAAGDLEDVEGADLDPAGDGLAVGTDDRALDRPAGIDLELEGDLVRPRRGVDLGQDVACPAEQ